MRELFEVFSSLLAAMMILLGRRLFGFPHSRRPNAIWRIVCDVLLSALLIILCYLVLQARIR